LIGLNVKILVFWTVMPIAEDGGSRFLWNVGTCPPGRLHGIWSRKTIVLIFTATKTQDLKCEYWSDKHY
jgi:hypothetical protein